MHIFLASGSVSAVRGWMIGWMNGSRSGSTDKIDGVH